MSPLAAIFLFLHVAGAIIAFGPTFTFPILGRVASREPRFGPAIITANVAIEKGLVIPLGLFQGVTGLGLILTVGMNPFDSAFHWLLAGIILYIVAFTIVFTVVYPNGEKLLHMAQAALAGPPPSDAPAGPPAAMLALIKRQQQAGMVLGVLLILIVYFMAIRPSL